MQNVGPNLFIHNENIVHIMPRGTAHAMTSCTHHAVHTSKPATLCICGALGITYEYAVRAS